MCGRGRDGGGGGHVRGSRDAGLRMRPTPETDSITGPASFFCPVPTWSSLTGPAVCPDPPHHSCLRN